MANINITIGNEYAPNIKEIYYYPSMDITDLEELTYCVDECYGIYLDRHLYNIQAANPSLPEEKIVEGCFYIIEEVVSHES